jgi:hypothetical protein
MKFLGPKVAAHLLPVTRVRYHSKPGPRKATVTPIIKIELFPHVNLRKKFSFDLYLRGQGYVAASKGDKFLRGKRSFGGKQFAG